MDDLSEKEQIEELRRWWSEYGGWILGGVVVAVGLIGGTNYYRSSQLEAQTEASDRYQQLAQHVGDGDLDEAELIAADIATNYATTAYAGQAGLAMARLYMDKNRDQDAADTLLSVIESDAEITIQNLARLRLARIYLYQEKPQDVVDLLASIDAGAFAAAYDEILGDAYAELGQHADAEAAYQQVLANPLAQGSVDLSLVQWKLLDLPQVVSAAEEEAAMAEDLPGDAG